MPHSKHSPDKRQLRAFFAAAKSLLHRSNLGIPKSVRTEPPAAVPAYSSTSWCWAGAAGQHIRRSVPHHSTPHSCLIWFKSIHSLGQGYWLYQLQPVRGLQQSGAPGRLCTADVMGVAIAVTAPMQNSKANCIHVLATRWACSFAGLGSVPSDRTCHHGDPG